MTTPVGTSQGYTATPAARGAAELCAVADISDEALAVLGDGSIGVRTFIARLQEEQLFGDAVRVLAHALPRREAVWWAWVCARKASGDTPEPAIKAALEATERWIVQPTEEHRRDAMTFGESADFGTPAGCSALAAFMTGGSLSPPHAPVVPPGEFMTAKAVAGSVTMAAVIEKPEQAPAKFKEFIGLGLEVADRIKLWPS